MSWYEDPWKRYERKTWDPFYRFEYERDREAWDPMYRMEREIERLREDPWYRQMHRMEHGLKFYQYADAVYVEEKEEGLGTRTNDYLNPDYRIHMDRKRRRERDFDPFIW